MAKMVACPVCGRRYSERRGHICPANVSPAGCADVAPVAGKVRARISAADRRAEETALPAPSVDDAIEAQRNGDGFSL